MVFLDNLHYLIVNLRMKFNLHLLKCTKRWRLPPFGCVDLTDPHHVGLMNAGLHAVSHREATILD